MAKVDLAKAKSCLLPPEWPAKFFDITRQYSAIFEINAVHSGEGT